MNKMIQIIILWISVVIAFVIILAIPYGVYALLTTLGVPFFLVIIGTIAITFATWSTFSYMMTTWND
jgi:hypothetical protein